MGPQKQNTNIDTHGHVARTPPLPYMAPVITHHYIMQLK